MNKLTPRQKLFCQEYVKDLNATQAAIRAGYAKKDADVQGPRLLGYVGVKEEIKKRMQKVAEKNELTAESVMASIAEIKARCMQSGKRKGKDKFNAPAALKAAELEAKYLGILTDNVNHSGSLNVHNRLVKALVGKK
jgi:phage terminase small subunit